jgi:hypothetical protein
MRGFQIYFSLGVHACDIFRNRTRCSAFTGLLARARCRLLSLVSHFSVARIAVGRLVHCLGVSHGAGAALLLQSPNAIVRLACRLPLRGHLGSCGRLRHSGRWRSPSRDSSPRGGCCSRYTFAPFWCSARGARSRSRTCAHAESWYRPHSSGTCLSVTCNNLLLRTLSTMTPNQTSLAFLSGEWTRR